MSLTASAGTVTKGGTNASGTWSWSFPTTDGPAQSQLVTITATDNHGASSFTTFQLNVANVAPTGTLTNSGPITEGGSATVSFAGPADASSVDAASLHYAFSCTGADLSSVAYASASTTNSAGCSFPDNGSFTVTGVIVDKDGGRKTDSTVVQVTNANPSVTAPSDQTANEGAATSLTLGSFTDPGPDSPWAVDVNWGDGSSHTTFNAATTGSLGSRSHTYDDNGSYTVTVKVTDKDGASGTKTFVVTVANVAPTGTFSNDGPVGEGSSFHLSLTGPGDPSSADTTAGFTYAFDCGDGSGYGGFGASSTTSCATTDNGTRNVKAKIKDKDGGTTEYTGTVTVTNVAPTASFGNDGPVDEGSSFHLSLTSPSDPSSADTTTGFTYAFDCGDGTGYSAFSGTATATCPTTDNGTRNVKAKIKDKDGGTNEYTGTVTVRNVAPTATFSNDGPVDEGSSFHLSLASPSDPSSADTTAGFTYAFDCGDGTGYGAFSAAAHGHVPHVGQRHPQRQGQDQGQGRRHQRIHRHRHRPQRRPHGHVLQRRPGRRGLELPPLADQPQRSVHGRHHRRIHLLLRLRRRQRLRRLLRHRDGQLPDQRQRLPLGRRPHPRPGRRHQRVHRHTAAHLLTRLRRRQRHSTFPATRDGGTTAYADTDHRQERRAAPRRFGNDGPGRGGHRASTSRWPTPAIRPRPIPPPASATRSTAATATATAPSRATPRPACPTSDNGTRDAGAKIRDKDGGTTSYTDTVNVTNVAPTVTAPANQTSDEGTSASFDLGSFTDSGADNPWAVDVNWGDGTTDSSFNVASPGSLGSRSHTYDDNGSYTVTVTVTDKDGGTDSETFTADVANVAPTATFSNDGPVDEGIQLPPHPDQPQRPLGRPTPRPASRYAFDCGDGNGYSTFSTAATATCPTNDNGTRDVGAKIRDKDGGTSEYTDAVKVTNVPPTVTAPADQTSDEGSSASFDLGSFTDPGADNPWAVDVNWGDGTTDTTFNAAHTGSLGSAHHTYADGPATETVTVTVTDKDGGTDSQTFQVTVNNVPPTVTLDPGNDTSVDEGSTHTYKFTATDPGVLDTLSPDAGYPDCDAAASNNGSLVSGSYSFDQATHKGSFQCFFPNGPATANVKIKMHDSDGGTSSASESVQVVQVANVPPTVTAPTDQASDEGSSASFDLGSFTDPGPDTPWAVTVDWGDGSATTNFNAASTGSLGSRSHTYDDNGTYTATVTVTDSDGASDSATFSVDVANVAPTASFGNDGPVEEGTSFHLSLTSPSDPSSADTTAGFTYAFDCGDGSGYGTFSSDATATCPTTDNGTRAVERRDPRQGRRHHRVHRQRRCHQRRTDRDLLEHGPGRRGLQLPALAGRRVRPVLGRHRGRVHLLLRLR